jgi:hypothetical protein
MANEDKKKAGLGERVFSGLIAIGIWEAGKLMYRSRSEAELVEDDDEAEDEDEDE